MSQCRLSAVPGHVHNPVGRATDGRDKADELIPFKTISPFNKVPAVSRWLMAGGFLFLLLLLLLFVVVVVAMTTG